MKIACIGARAFPGISGIDAALSELIPRLANKGYDITVYVREPYVLDGEDNGRFKQVKFKSISCIKNKYLETPVYTLKAVLHSLKDNYDLFFFHAVVTGLFIPIVKVLGNKVVLQTHGLDWKREKWNWFAKLVIKLSAYSGVRFSDCIVSVSYPEVEYFEKIIKKKVYHIPNGISPCEITSETRELERFGINPKRYVLFLSRLVPEKGCHILVDAWKNLENEIKKDIQLVIAGDTSSKDNYYFSLIKDKSIDIIFTGFASGELKKQLFSHALALIQPSTMEGMPVSVLEAMGYGIPVISSDIKELTDIIFDKDLVFKKNNVNDLKSILKKFLKDYKQHKDLAIERKEEVSKMYSWDSIANQFDELFQTIKQRK